MTSSPYTELLLRGYKMLSKLMDSKKSRFLSQTTEITGVHTVSLHCFLLEGSRQQFRTEYHSPSFSCLEQ